MNAGARYITLFIALLIYHLELYSSVFTLCKVACFCFGVRVFKLIVVSDFVKRLLKDNVLRLTVSILLGHVTLVT